MSGQGLPEQGLTEQELANPFLESLGTRLVAWRYGYAEMSLPLSHTLKNRSGAVQGGVICALLDSAAGYSGLHTPHGDLSIHSLTISLSVNFLANGQGEFLRGKGYMQKQGSSVYFARSEVWLNDDLLIATAMGTFRYLNSGAAQSDG